MLDNCLDKNTFCILINEKKEGLYRMAYMHVKNSDDALEIVQEAIYKAYLSFEKLKDLKYFNTWITRIVINCSIDYIRKRKKLVFLEENISSWENNTDNKEELIDLYNAVDKLKGNSKTIVILKYFEGLTINNIAEILDYPVSKVKNNLHKALKELRLELKEEDY